uniref:WD40 domain-containing protein n=1 Tax=Trepomonas sp. PC1 TaxID=1076344 RepID=A0A146K8Y6_9EUKA|eukprot:JAP93057.1 WD40 domain-containing protein [Trepomonas sp. PC1]
MKLHPNLNAVALGCSDQYLRILFIDKQEFISFPTDSKPSCVNFSNDGTVVVCGMQNGSLNVYDFNDQQLIKKLEKIHSQPITQAVLYRDLIVTASVDKLFQVFRNFSKIQTVMMQSTFQLNMVNDTLVASQEDGIVQLYQFNAVQFVNIAEQFRENELFVEVSRQLEAESFVQPETHQKDQFNLVSKFERQNCQQIQNIIFQGDYLFLTTKKAVEIYFVKPLLEVQKHQKQRVNRTVKQRLERIQNQLQQNKISSDRQIELKQLFSPVEVVSFNDLFESCQVILLQQVTNASIHQFSTSVKILFSQLGQLSTYTLLKEENKLNLNQQQQSFNHPINTCCMNQENTVILLADQQYVKLYSVRNCQQLASIELPDNLNTPVVSIILNGNLYAVILSVSGLCCIVNLLQNQIENLIQIHEKRIVSAYVQNDQLTTFSEDGFIKFYSFKIQNQQLSLIEERSIDTNFTLTCGLCYKELIIFGCSDNQIRIHYFDTFKFKMCLYGHSLPPLQLQMSSTGERLFSIGADKTLRSWGLTFGECLKQIKLQKSPSTLLLIPDTHLVFVTSKEGQISQFDMDSYQFIYYLGEGNYGKKFVRGHFAPIRCSAMSSNGKFFVTAGADGGKTWIQSSDLVSIQDEEQKQLKVEAVGENLAWGEKLNKEQVDWLDQLEEMVDSCFVKYENQLKPVEEEDNTNINSNNQVDQMRLAYNAYKKQQNQPWQVEIVNFLIEKCPRTLVVDLMRALPVSCADRLKQMLIQLIQNGNQQEQVVWVLLRLVRSVYNGQGGQVGVIMQRVLMGIYDKTQSCLGQLNMLSEE